jgi:hypothetical protein
MNIEKYKHITPDNLNSFLKKNIIVDIKRKVVLKEVNETICMDKPNNLISIICVYNDVPLTKFYQTKDIFIEYLINDCRMIDENSNRITEGAI